jgi:hypothetical protein
MGPTVGTAWFVYKKTGSTCVAVLSTYLGALHVTRWFENNDRHACNWEQAWWLKSSSHSVRFTALRELDFREPMIKGNTGMHQSGVVMAT